MSHAAPTPGPLSDDSMLRGVPDVDGWKVLTPAVLYAKIGQGGMGAVYRGRHLELEIDVAVKCLKPSLVAEDDQFEVRFRREARLAAELTHDNLIRLYELRREHGLTYLILEFVDGETARDRVLRKGPLDEEEAVTILLGAARGLAKAHRHKSVVVHRDIKPENILVSKEGEVKLADLGIAKALETTEDASMLTLGAIGTPVFMAPEQWEDPKSVGPATDIWAMGATLYFLLAGETAVSPGTQHQISYAICHRPFPDVRKLRPDLSKGVLRILKRCTKRDPAGRYADANELVRELENFLGGRTTSLSDQESGKANAGAGLLSPPPAHTLKKIRVASMGSTPPPRAMPATKLDAQRETLLDTPAAPAADGRGDRETIREQPVEPSAPPAAVPTRHSRNALWISLITILVAGGTGLALYEWFKAPAPPSGITFETPLHDGKLFTKDLAVTVIGNRARSTDRGIEVQELKDLNPALLQRTPVLQGAQYAITSKDVEIVPTLGTRFRLEVKLAPNETKHLVIKESDVESVSFDVIQDSTPPVITIRRPDEASRRTWEKSITVWLDVEDAGVARVSVADEPLWSLRKGLPFTGNIQLPLEGRNDLPIVAEDWAGNRSTSTLTIERDPTAVTPLVLVRTPKAPAGWEIIDRTLGNGGWAKKVKEPKSGIVFVLVAPGSFLMGSPADEELRGGDEQLHNVEITKPFYLAETETTQEQYERIAKANPSYFKDASNPVEQVDWNSARSFCKTLACDLPTEAQWEFACRAGTTTPFSYGPTLRVDQANYDGSASYGSGSKGQNRQKTTAAKSFRPNAWGFFDMHGNVLEWCADGYREDYQALSKQDPVQLESDLRVLRGGSWLNDPKDCRSGLRARNHGDEAFADVGFRVARALP